MINYFENKLTYNGISFCLSNKLTIDEREIHSYHEILFYIDGAAELLTKNGQRPLRNNSLIVIPRETYHFIRLANCDSFTRLKISFPSSVLKETPLSDMMREMRILENVNENISHMLQRLKHVLEEGGDDSGFYAYSAFLMLITELYLSDADKPAENDRKVNVFTAELTEYIDRNLSQDLSIDTLARSFHMSPSSITHLFKKEVGISLHKYVSQKRLVFAQRLLLEGQQLSKIYTDLGFKDYSSFYKAYVKYFGYPPSRDKNTHL